MPAYLTMTNLLRGTTPIRFEWEDNLRTTTKVDKKCQWHKKLSKYLWLSLMNQLFDVQFRFFVLNLRSKCLKIRTFGAMPKYRDFIIWIINRLPAKKKNIFYYDTQNIEPTKGKKKIFNESERNQDEWSIRKICPI